MNTNLKSCPKCGHSVKDTAAPCAYCRAVISAGDPSLQTGEKTPAEATPYPEQTPPMQPEEPLPDITEPEEPANTLATVVGRLEPDDSDPPPAAHSAEQASEPISEPAPIKTEHESAIEISDHSQVVESNQEVSPKTSESRVDIHQVAADALVQASIPGHMPEPAGELGRKDPEPEAKTAELSDNALQETEEQVETETAAEQPRLSPETDVLESGDNEPTESATPEPERSEWAKFEASPASDTVLPFDEAVAEGQTGKVQDAPPAEADKPVTEPAAVPENEAPKEDILLTLDEIVQPPAKDTPDSVGKLAGEVAETETGASTTEVKSDNLPSQDKVQTETEAIPKKAKVQCVAKVLKIEKAAQDMDEAVKKQKAALAEARALKKQKLMRAKAQALKRKEETLAGAQAFKKQKEAQAGTEISKKENAAQSVSKTKSRHRMTMQSLKAHTKMQVLLKKYANQAIGINYDNSADIKEAELVEVNDEFFSVFVKHNTLQYSYPLNTILTVIEGKDGVGSADHEQEEKFNVVIKVCPLVFS
jgi:hypothetical protein